MLETEDIDLVLLDILMPEMDGHEVCRRIRSNPATEFLPVVMITASGSEQRLAALEAGADDFITKPFDQSELLARVASLARIKRYHDTIRRQADELAEWNTELEARVDRAGRRVGAHQPATPLPVTATGRSGHRRRDASCESHRREIVVVFTDLRNFTPFAETSEPEEVMGVLRRVSPGHRGAGPRIRRHARAVHRRRGHGVLQRPDPVRRRRGACGPDGAGDPRRRERACRTWRRKGHDLALGIGIAQGFATLGRIGFEGRFDYAAIGSVTNLAARLCSDAGPWQVLVTDRVLAAIEHMAVSEMVGDVQPKGFSRSVRVHNIKALDKRTE